MIKRRRTISFVKLEEAMEETTAEISPTATSTRKRKRLDPVSTAHLLLCISFRNESNPKSLI